MRVPTAPAPKVPQGLIWCSPMFPLKRPYQYIFFWGFRQGGHVKKKTYQLIAGLHLKKTMNCVRFACFWCLFERSFWVGLWFIQAVVSLTNNLPQEVRFFAGLQHAVNLAKRNAEESCALVASSWEFGLPKGWQANKRNPWMHWKINELHEHWHQKNAFWYEWIDELLRMSRWWRETAVVFWYGVMLFLFGYIIERSFHFFWWVDM